MDDLITWLRAQLDLDERYADEYPPFQARVLREVKVKRLMMDMADMFLTAGMDDGWDLYRLLALPFSDRPGYREEWKP